MTAASDERPEAAPTDPRLLSDAQLAEIRRKWSNVESSLGGFPIGYILAHADAQREEIGRLTERAARLEIALGQERRVAALRHGVLAGLASAWFFGNWKAETLNERAMQAGMEQLGYWPTTEADLVAWHDAIDAAMQSAPPTEEPT